MATMSCRWQFTPSQEEVEHVKEMFGDLTIPENFVSTVTPFSHDAMINHRAG